MLGTRGIRSVPTNISASNVWSMNEAYEASLDDIWPSPNPPVAGYIGWYAGDSWTGSQWQDKSGNNNHATVVTGSITQANVTGNGATETFPAIYGGTTAGIRFPSAILPSTFTLFHVARYDGVTEKRIFDGLTANWLSGFWNGKAGAAYHDGWITDQVDYHTANWVISTDQNSRYRSKSKSANSGNYYQHTGGGGTNKQLTINYGSAAAERSDWMVAEVIVYNSTLSSADYNLVESYLENKYGI